MEVSWNRGYPQSSIQKIAVFHFRYHPLKKCHVSNLDIYERNHHEISVKSSPSKNLGCIPPFHSIAPWFSMENPRCFHLQPPLLFRFAERFAGRPLRWLKDWCSVFLWGIQWEEGVDKAWPRSWQRWWCNQPIGWWPPSCLINLWQMMINLS